MTDLFRPGPLAEAFGRFSPPDSARLAVIAKASVAESKNHLRDAVHKGHISDDTRQPLHQLAEEALAQVIGYITYLQSDEARENVRRIRERQSRRRRSQKKKRARKGGGTAERGTPKSEPEPKPEQEPEPEPE